ncbi:hypothetical protein Tco_1510915, partial [Tanacetum coccineum]
SVEYRPTGFYPAAYPANYIGAAQSVYVFACPTHSANGPIICSTAATLHDLAFGAWNMDTSASSHLNNSVTSLSDVFNTCIYPSVSVGNGHSIPVTNTGHVTPRQGGNTRRNFMRIIITQWCQQ